MPQTTETIILPMYQGRRGKADKAEFEIIRDADTAETYCNGASHVWFVSTSGDARQAKVNGKVRRWKLDRARIEIPLKYGLYEYYTMDRYEVEAGRLLRMVRPVE